MASGPSERYDSHRRLNHPAVDEESCRRRDHCRARSPVTSVSNRLQDSIRLSCGSGSGARGRVLPEAAIGQYEAVLADLSLLAKIIRGLERCHLRRVRLPDPLFATHPQQDHDSSIILLPPKNRDDRCTASLTGETGAGCRIIAAQDHQRLLNRGDLRSCD